MQEAKGENEPLEMMSPSQVEYQRVMSENLNGDRLSHRIISYKEKAPTAPEGKWILFVCCHCFCFVVVFVWGVGRLHFVSWKFISLRSSGVLPWGKPAVTEWCYLSNKSLMLCKCRDLVYFSTICTGHGIVAQQHLHVLLVTVLKHTSDQFRTTC